MVMRYVNRSHTGRCTTNRLPLGQTPNLPSGILCRLPRTADNTAAEAMCEKCPPATWKRLSCPFPVLNRVGLAWCPTPKICIDRRYVLRSHATGADLNVASILASGKMGRLVLSSHSNLARWLDSCLARPAYGRVRDRTRRK